MTCGPQGELIPSFTVPQSSSTPLTQASSSSAAQFEFNESTAVTLEWRLNGLKAMFDSTKGEAKS